MTPRCFLNESRSCDKKRNEHEGMRCKMWDPDEGECLLVALARVHLKGTVTYTTTFPESPPPPEVK